MKYNLIVLTGPTASGKTRVAAKLAAMAGGEIISADSRQVYRRMTLGTGKDLADYTVDGVAVPYHLIDIAEPGDTYNVFRFKQDFENAYTQIISRNNLPVLCGGTGMYIEAVIRDFNLIDVPVNEALRTAMANKSLEELTEILSNYKSLHNHTDTDTVRRAIRAIEIADYYSKNDMPVHRENRLNPLVIGIDIDRDLRRKKISDRLKSRFNQGMVDEVKRLLDDGVDENALIGYGLEYKYLTLYVTGKISYDQMYSQLEIAIHQFAKRQMTWFRGMERRGVTIKWLDANMPDCDKLIRIKQWMNQ